MRKKLNLLNFVTFKELWEKTTFLKISAQAFEAGDFLNVFLRFLGFWDSFSSKHFSYVKKNVYYYQVFEYLMNSFATTNSQLTFTSSKSKIETVEKGV